MMMIDGHNGGKLVTCPRCNGKCMFYNANGSLTRYSFSCGYIEVKGSKNLSMEHGVYHVKGTDTQGNRVWQSYASLTEARKFLSKR